MLNDIVNEKIDMSKLIISKSLRSFYKNPQQNLASGYLLNGLINSIKEGRNVKTETIANNIASPVKTPK